MTGRPWAPSARVKEEQTVHVCKHCLQRVGEPHLLTCPHAVKTEPTD